MLAFAIGAALAVQPVQASSPVAASDFDLSSAVVPRQSPDAPAPLAPVKPRNLDTHDSAAPEAEWQLAEGGPVVMVGAMGGRRSGMPKLAHVALDWSF